MEEAKGSLLEILTKIKSEGYLIDQTYHKGLKIQRIAKCKKSMKNKNYQWASQKMIESEKDKAILLSNKIPHKNDCEKGDQNLFSLAKENNFNLIKGEFY